MSKGDKRRPCQITSDRWTLNYKLAINEISREEHEKELRQLENKEHDIKLKESKDEGQTSSQS